MRVVDERAYRKVAGATGLGRASFRYRHTPFPHSEHR